MPGMASNEYRHHGPDVHGLPWVIPVLVITFQAGAESISSP